MTFWKQFLRDESGATSIEYALIMAFVFLVILTAMTMFAKNSTDKMIDASNQISAAMK